MENNTESKKQSDSLSMVQEIIKAFFLDEQLTVEQTEFLQVNFENIQEFLDAPLNSPKDAETKKIFAKVILLAKQKGILPKTIEKIIPTAKPNETIEERQDRLEETAEIIGNNVDDGCDRLKTAYKVGKGEMLAHRAIDYFIDKATIYVSNLADKLIDKGFDWVINKGSKYIERSFPKLIPIVEVGKRILKVAKPAVKTIVRTGIKTVSSFAKSVIKKAVDITTTVSKKVVSSFRGFLGRFGF